jgi:hypothetical protein
MNYALATRRNLNICRVENQVFFLNSALYIQFQERKRKYKEVFVFSIAETFENNHSFAKIKSFALFYLSVGLTDLTPGCWFQLRQQQRKKLFFVTCIIKVLKSMLSIRFWKPNVNAKSEICTELIKRRIWTVQYFEM